MNTTLLKPGLVQTINSFLRKPAYIMLLALMAALSFALGAELLAYSVLALVVGYTCIHSEDLLPLLPILAYAYVIPSTANNPGQSEDSIFSGAAGIYVAFIGALIGASLVYRLVRDRKRLFRAKGMLTESLIILTFAYALSGIGFRGYLDVAWKNIPYGIIQGVSLLLPYWLVIGSVDWEKTRKDYFAWIGFGMGCLLSFEIICIYISQDVINNGAIDRTLIYAGWGMYNNIGNLLAMMIPFAFWLGVHYKKLVVGYIFGIVFLGFVFLTCSRSSMIFSTLCFCTCWLIAPDREHRKYALIAFAVAAFAGLVVLGIFFDKIYDMFAHILDDVHELGSRIDIYWQGLNEFAKNPIFGRSFYPAAGLSYNWASTDIISLMPPRWHNTVIQLMASTGLVGVIAYGYYRYQTIRLALRCKTRQQILMVISAMVLILGALTDTHMFNVGPCMFYAMIMAWVEKKELNWQ